MDRLEERALLSVSPASLFPNFDDAAFSKVGFDLAKVQADYFAYRGTTHAPEDDFRPQNRIVQTYDSYVVVDAIAEGNTASLYADLQRLGLQRGAMFGSVVSGLLPIDHVDEMARLASLNFARPAYQPITNVGRTTSQADLSMNADEARRIFGVDGTGVTVGVLSDSFDSLGGGREDSATGDLPPFHELIVLEDLPPESGSDEGRAMMQLIHDVAPGADLAFHTAFTGQAGFAQGILALAQEANADVIVDDVIYLAEPMFQDGIIAQAVDFVKDAGVSYFSSAGNLDRLAYQDRYVNASYYLPTDGREITQGEGAPPFLGGYPHIFGPGLDEFNDMQLVNIPPGTLFTVVFQWDQPYRSANPGGTGPGAANNVDIYLLNEDGTETRAGSIGLNVGGDPIEIFSWLNTTSEEFFNLMIVKFAGRGGGTFFSDPSLVIPDDGMPVTDSITVDNIGPFPIIDVNVTVNIAHPRVRDLEINLIGPDMVPRRLFNVVPKDGANLTNTTFDDAPTNPLITSGTPPYPGRFRTVGNVLNGLNGSALVNGEWMLEITDRATNQMLGVLQDWTLEIQVANDLLPDPGLMKYVIFDGAQPLELFAGNNAGTVYGHANAAGATAVGAAPYDTSPRYTIDGVQLESFSSAGFTPILFDKFGNRLTAQELRQKPEIVAPDGTNTTFFPGSFSDEEADGFPNFFGTSAAAPHAAAVAALMLELVPGTSPDDIYGTLERTTVDFLARGFDYDSGFGFIQADEALRVVSLLRRSDISGTVFNDFNEDGVRGSNEPYISEIFTVFLDENGNGVLDADPSQPVRHVFEAQNLPLVIQHATSSVPSIVRSSLLVSGIDGSIGDVEVELDITHTAVGDLRVVLVSARGTRIELFDRIGGFGDNLSSTTLADRASLGIAAGAAPYSGTFRPFDPLSRLAGENANGTWTLEITDRRTGNFGTLDSWSLALRDGFASRRPPLVIPDTQLGSGSATVSTTLVVNGFAGNLVGALVNLDITHTSADDLSVFLISPKGTRIELFTRVGGQGDHFHDTTLADDASRAISDGAAPFSGRFRPFDPLSKLAGEDPNGIWTLELSDLEFLDTGTLDSWSLTLLYTELSTEIDSFGNYSFSNLPAGSYTVAAVLNELVATGVPADGFRQTTPQAIEGSNVLITEVDLGATDSFEIQNVTGAAADTAGWFVAISDSPFADINDVNPIIWNLPDSVAAREVLYSTESPADHYFGGNIFWNKGNSRIGSGWVMIVDNLGNVRDWVGWGWDEDDLASFEVTLPVEIGGVPVHILGLDGIWSGRAVERSGPGTIQRFGNQDANLAADFRWFDVFSLSGTNAGLRIPFESVAAEEIVSSVPIRPGVDIIDLAFGNIWTKAFPQVIDHLRRDIISDVAGFIDFHFPEQMDVGSFDINADVISFTGPAGSLKSQITHYQWRNEATHLRVFFPPQFASGEYQMVIGPNIASASSDVAPSATMQNAYTGTFQIAFGEIQGLQWNDLNANRRRDANEPGLGGWTIFLDFNGNEVLDTASITFDSPTVPVDVLDGTTAVSYIGISGMTGPINGVNVTLDVTRNSTTGLTATLTSPQGTAFNLASVVSGSSGLLSAFNGQDPNGVWTLAISDALGGDPIAAVLNAWSLAITLPEPRTSTSADGSYRLQNLQDRTYTVAEVIPAGWIQTFPTGFHFSPPLPGTGLTPTSVPAGSFLPRQYRLFEVDGALSEPAAGGALDIAMAYLRQHAGDLGLRATDFDNVVVTDQYVSRHTGMTHIYLGQTWGGLDVINATLNINVDAHGRIVSINGGFVPGLAFSRFSPLSPALGATQAVVSAANSFGVTMTATPNVIHSLANLRQTTTLVGPGFSLDEIPAELVYVPNFEGGVTLGWNMVARTPDGDHWYDVTIDDTTGERLYTSDWVDRAQYEVFAIPKEAPNDPDSTRTIEVNPAHPVASPLGWHDTGTTQYTDTRGNNVFAQEDRDDNNRDGFRPDGGAALNFSGPAFAFNDVTLDPIDYDDAAIVNLFYWNNILHDVHFLYGFDEAGGNFQVRNSDPDLSARGNDAVQADAQDGEGTNNANFATPPDGFAPRMQQFIWTFPPPSTLRDRDSDLDNQVIVHEYGHGVSNRLTGGPANSNALNAIQSGGMGEGWGDWWALMFTQKPSDTKLAGYGVGTYLLGQSNTGPGIRRFPYSFNMAINPLTYGNFNLNNEVHDSGEIWCSALWDLNWLLIDKYGFNQDLYAGFTGPGSAGNHLALQLVMDGLKIQPANPSFLDGRNAILLADMALTGGENQLEIWTAFARRGMGYSAWDGGSAAATVVTEAFDLPPRFPPTHTVALGAGEVFGDDGDEVTDFGNRFTAPAPIVVGHTVGATADGSLSHVDFQFSKAMSPASFDRAADISAFTGPNGDLRPQITAHQWLSGDTILRIQFAPQSDAGNYLMTIGPNILSADISPFPMAQSYTAVFDFVDLFDFDAAFGGNDRARQWFLGNLDDPNGRHWTSVDLGATQAWQAEIGLTLPAGEDVVWLAWWLDDGNNDFGYLDGVLITADGSPGPVAFENFQGIVNFVGGVNAGVPTVAEGAQVPWFGGRFDAADPINLGPDIAVVQNGNENAGTGNATHAARFRDDTGLLLKISTLGLQNVRLFYGWRTRTTETTDTFRFGYYVGELPFGAFGSSDELVQQTGRAVAVRGTAADDQFRITTGAVHRLTVNGVDYSFDAASVDTITLDGAGGSDLLQLSGSTADEVLKLYPDAATFTGGGLTLDVRRVAKIQAQAGGGSDQAVFYDSTGDDQFFARGEYAQMSGGGYFNYAKNFDLVKAYAGQGVDTAVLYDSAGDDSFFGRPDYSQLSGPGYSMWVKGFESVRAYAGAGKDTAVLYDSAGNDVLVAKPAFAQLSGASYLNYAKNFDTVKAYAGAGYDTASLYDSSGDDELLATPTYARLTGRNFFQYAKNFDQVRAYAGAGLDRARLEGSSASDQFTATPTYAQVAGAAFMNYARNFDVVESDGMGGADQAVLVDTALDDHLEATGNMARFTNDQLQLAYLAYNYRTVTAQSSSGHDTKSLTAIDFLLEGGDDWLTM